MIRKKDGKKEARLDSPVAELGEKETLMHYNVVLMEDVNAKMQLVLECMKTSHEELLKRMVDMEERFEQRFLLLESAMRSLKEDMADMERRLSSKINRITERCGQHECRLGALEARH